jgi:hypothetical protein
MSQGKRIARGFSRIGAWAAVMAVIVGVGLTGIWAAVQYLEVTGIGIGLGLTVLDDRFHESCPNDGIHS